MSAERATRTPRTGARTGSTSSGVRSLPRRTVGSRHGLAFAVFALQHPRRFPADTGSRALELLTRVVERRKILIPWSARCGAAFPQRPAWARPSGVADPLYHVTIADLGDFAAADYAARLDEWCRATLSCFASDSSWP